MSKKLINPNFPPKSLPDSISNSFMAHNQLIDSLTSHISLYHSHSLPPNPNPNSNNLRSVILKWFTSLTLHQRLAHLTTVDQKFTRIVIQMLGKVRLNGHGCCFIILPDLPSGDLTGLPSLCYKKSRGLLSRVAESNESERLLFESVRLFGSRDGEEIRDCSCSVSCLDSFTVTEELVGNVDCFVEMMDNVSNGAFLRAEENELGSDWVELKWLKSKGYYSMEAFIANRLEVGLRLAWMNCNNGKKRGLKLREKLNERGIAANVYWRKKGCVDWWENLDAAMRRKIFTLFLGKSAKYLTQEILRGADRASEDERWLFNAGGEPLSYQHSESSQRMVSELSSGSEVGSTSEQTSVSRQSRSSQKNFNSLRVLQEIIALTLSCQRNEYDTGEIFFSALGSVSTIPDCILRKMRGFLMVTSLDCTKIELLESVCKSPPNRSNGKSGSSKQRKKGRCRNTTNSSSVSKSCLSEHLLDKPSEDHHCPVHNIKEVNLMEANKLPQKSLEKDTRQINSSAEQMEHDEGSLGGKVRSVAKKSRKRKKKKNSSDHSAEVRNSERPAAEVEKFNGVPNDSVVQNISTNLNGSESFAWNSSLSSFSNKLFRDNVNGQSTKEDNSVLSPEGFHHSGPESNIIEKQTISFVGKMLDSKVDCNAVLPGLPALGLDDHINDKDVDFPNSVHSNDSDVKASLSEKSITGFEVKGESAMSNGPEKRDIGHAAPTSSSEYLSYEWPSVAPIYFPSVNSHLFAATDRLHLDVGHNWHNHVRQPFVPTVHPARNTPVEVGCSQILSGPVPMSLDWPPMVRSACGLAASLNCKYDSGFISKIQTAFQHSVQFNAKAANDERKYSGDIMDLHELQSSQELEDECDNQWMSEDELEVHAVSARDYNQYFGGGVMYWNPSDHPGTGFSRPPSLSSDDSSWAWHDADINRTVDDMVAFSSSYSTNGLTSPTAASFCSPFDPLAAGHQPLSYVVAGNDMPGKGLHTSLTTTEAAAEEEVSGSLTSLSGDGEGNAGDSLSYPMLRPIIIPNMPRERSRSEFKRGYDLKSPCVPPTRREEPRIKRPPSPVVLCVPHLPPPSPVGDSRKHRGFPIVRSGSSSPRHWGMRGWYHDGTNSEEACLRMDGSEVVWPSWRKKNLPARPMIQPLPGALLQDRLMAMTQLARDQEHPDVAIPLEPPELLSCPARKESLALMHNFLHDEIDSFCKQVAAENMARRPYINWAVKRVTRSLQVLWPRSRTNIFGSKATGLSLPSSDVDLVVCLPPVRNLEPIKEAGILEGRNGIKETCLQHAARYLANQEWVKNDSLKTVENTAIPIIMLVVEVPCDFVSSVASNIQLPKESESTSVVVDQSNHVNCVMVGLEDSASPKSSQTTSNNMNSVKSVRIDISFKTPSHTGLQTTELVKELTEQFPAATPLALILKQFLADRSLDQSYSGGLSSYCLVLLITRFLQHEHHLGRPINQNFGGLMTDFLYFFGNVFDPRHMRISVQGSGIYINREKGYSIDPIHIDDPLFPTNNVGRNCFRIHQCTKAFSEAYSILENELSCISNSGDSSSMPPYRLLPKLIPSISL